MNDIMNDMTMSIKIEKDFWNDILHQTGISWLLEAEMEERNNNEDPSWVFTFLTEQLLQETDFTEDEIDVLLEENVKVTLTSQPEFMTADTSGIRKPPKRGSVNKRNAKRRRDEKARKKKARK